MKTDISVTKLTIPTYPEAPFEPLPMFAETRVHQRSSGNPYPNAVVIHTRSSELVEREYAAVILENAYIRLTILPELGGRIFRAVDKRTGYDFFYRQSVIKPALIGALGSWISGGVEFNFPYHHRPSTFLPVDYSVRTEPDGSAALYLSEHDPFDRMKGSVIIRLRPDSTAFETEARVYNRTPERHSFLWWENAAVPVNEDYRIFFPEDVGRVYFHYRRNSTTYPLADGVYNGHEFGQPTDIRRHGNTRFATSFFSDRSDYDFFGGWDERRDCGVLHFANRHTSPGKKLFTWGYGQLSKSWERALTDADGAYAELMASSYSSNQPDFSWLEPYETKSFSQFWYPLSGTGVPDFANRDFTLTLIDGGVRISSTRRFEGLRIEIKKDSCVLLNSALDIDPTRNVELPVGDGECEFIISDGVRRLLYYKKRPRAEIAETTLGDLPRPEECETAEKAYLTGLHMLQYRDPKGMPELYFERSLELEAENSRALLGLAEVYMKRRDYMSAKGYLIRAEAALTRLNRRPESGRCFYLLGLCEERLGNPDAAYERYWEAAVITDAAPSAYTRIAALELRRGEYDAAYDDAIYALGRGTDNSRAKLLAALAKHKLGEDDAAVGLLDEILASDPLCHVARYAKVICGAETADNFFDSLRSSPTQTCIDIYEELCECGFGAEANELLHRLIGRGQADAMAYYLLGEPAGADVGRTFPFRDCERAALEKMEDDPRCRYLLGCQYFSERRYDDAARLWNTLDCYEAKRGLAIYHWRRGEREKALELLREAFQSAPEAGREQLMWELSLCYNRCGKYNEVIALLGERRGELRDDTYLELVHAYNKLGEYETALGLLAEHEFIPCEGGEPAVTSRYIEASLGIAGGRLGDGDIAGALKAYRDGQIIPDNLGAGLWNDAPLMPLIYGEGICLDMLGERDAARKKYETVLSLQVDFFTNMQEPLLPVYQALALSRLGRADEARELANRTISGFEGARELRDGGYFATTPFFDCYFSDAKTARAERYDALISSARRLISGLLL